MIASHFKTATHPIADPAATVSVPGARFTVLTSRLIRMEQSAGERFEDRASQAFWHRRQPVPPYRVRLGNGVLEIETEHLHLRYRATPRGFRPDTLSVEVRQSGVVWHCGDKDPGNLLGTARTLDGADGRVRLEQGLLSRAGWAIVDDSSRLVFDDDGWLRPRPAGGMDVYFFGYGNDYRGCLSDYSKVAGPAPMIPRWALGNWWSRYWEYSQAELTSLIADFREHETPLSVCIIDMDWHLTNTGNAASGWTGYTWNKELWPDPYRFIAWLHEQGLHTAMNLHPAEGIWPHEEQYPAMAQAMGIDPASEEPVRFDISDPHFMDAYFAILHHPMEEKGVDFWWMDWQQGTQSRLAGLDPLWFLNHLHFYDRGRDGKKRPFVFSRWGGLGNQRYPIGFSGDTVVSWNSLAFQPYFTATAANVNFGWWSHDIGGHMRGHEDPELYARWVQFGVFSPIMRLHSTKNAYHDRRPWGHGKEAFDCAQRFLQLRHALIPYLYSMAWRNYRESAPLVAPMYHSHPHVDDACLCPNQYWFGSELIVSPFVRPRDPATRLARQVVWLPAGDWFGFFSGERVQGGGWRAIYGGLADMPVFAKAGAIVPLAPMRGWGGLGNPDELNVTVFPGADSEFVLYEDDGDSTAFQNGRYAETVFRQRWQSHRLELILQPAAGDTTALPRQRVYKLSFRGVASPKRVYCVVNGVPQALDVRYEEASDTLACGSFALAPDGAATVVLESESSLLSSSDRTPMKARAMLQAFDLETRAKAGIDADLPNIVKDLSRLGAFWLDLQDSQAFALAEVIAKKALDRGETASAFSQELQHG